jgi:hypothetical protein
VILVRETDDWGLYVTSLVVVTVVRAIFSALPNKATASSSRTGIVCNEGHGGRVVSKNSACLSLLVKASGSFRCILFVA